MLAPTILYNYCTISAILPKTSQNNIVFSHRFFEAVIKNADMAEDMQQDAIDCATQALEKYNIEMLGQLFTRSGLCCLVWIIYVVHLCSKILSPITSGPPNMIVARFPRHFSGDLPFYAYGPWVYMQEAVRLYLNQCRKITATKIKNMFLRERPFQGGSSLPNHAHQSHHTSSSSLVGRERSTPPPSTPRAAFGVDRTWVGPSGGEKPTKRSSKPNGGDPIHCMAPMST